MVDGGGCEFVVSQVALLVLGGVFGFGKSCQVRGEDNAAWVTKEGGVNNFMVDRSSAVGCVGWLCPEDALSLVSYACGEEGLWVIKFELGNCSSVFRRFSLALVLILVMFVSRRCIFG